MSFAIPCIEDVGLELSADIVFLVISSKFNFTKVYQQLCIITRYLGYFFVVLIAFSLERAIIL